MFYFGIATAFAVLTVVYSNEWALDSHINDELIGSVQNFDIQRVSMRNSHLSVSILTPLEVL